MKNASRSHPIAAENTPLAFLVEEPYRAGHEESVKTSIHNLVGLDKRFLSARCDSLPTASETDNWERVSAGRGGLVP